MKSLPNITPLRFFLALAVILFHLPEFCINRGFPYYNGLPIFFKGTEAVYVFFSLSGFLIIRNLLVEKKEHNHIDLNKFYLRRILRIFPLYYLILVIGFVYYLVVLPAMGFAYNADYNIADGILLGATFFANILATFQPGGILEILWSIGVEEQFYLLIAPVIFLLKYKRVALFLAAFTALYFILYNLPAFDVLRKYHMLFFYFSCSGVIAYASLNITLPKYFKLIRITSAIFFVLIFSSNIIINNVPDAVYHLICMITFSVFIWMLSLQPLPVLNTKPLNYLGKISYGIYMYHAVMFQLIGLIFLKTKLYEKVSYGLSVFIFYGAVIASTIFISHLSYKYFESYFIRKKQY